MKRAASGLDNARLSLEGLSVGDAFGEAHFFARLPDRPGSDLAPAPWRWTDDTHMALSIVEVLREHGAIEQDALIRAFARRFAADPYRGYGSGARALLRAVGLGADWREVAPTLFPGGSMGNGAAMRAGPIGGFFAGDPLRAAQEARASAAVTHTHPEGQAGAMAVAAAAAIASRCEAPSAADFLREILTHVPNGATRAGIQRALDFGPDAPEQAAEALGTGLEVTAPDTVPFCLWCAAHRLHDYQAAVWQAASPLGDRDTICAIVGSIVVLASGGVPEGWLASREPLPDEVRLEG